MTDRFLRRFRVRHYELDASGQVGSVVLVRYMQEAAIEASTALGFSPEWYSRQGAGWVVRRLTVRYLAPLVYGDEVEVATWIAQMRGVRSLRDYDVARRGDGARIAQGRAEWVYVDMQSGQPTRVPDGWLEAFSSRGRPEQWSIRPENVPPIAQAHRHSSRHRVGFHELDAVRHVNHAVYLEWAEQAVRDALRVAGERTDDGLPQGWEVRPAGHEIQYFASALDQDDIAITSWLSETTDHRLGWTHELVNAQTTKLLARDYSVWGFTSAGEPSAPPERLIENLIRGPNA
jgi:YbgC/YbaW family acyl-CoA thioester hydrolase